MKKSAGRFAVESRGGRKEYSEVYKGKMMMKKWSLLILGLLLLLTACSSPTKNNQEMVFLNITAEEARKLMDSEKDSIILDVRSREEYDQGHIPGAILIPDTEIEAKAADLLPDKDQLILVYCRSGRRSKLAAQSLADLGYTNIREFGGILDWPYEVVKDN